MNIEPSFNYLGPKCPKTIPKDQSDQVCNSAVCVCVSMFAVSEYSKLASLARPLSTGCGQSAALTNMREL